MTLNYPLPISCGDCGDYQLLQNFPEKKDLICLNNILGMVLHPMKSQDAVP